MLLVYTEKDNPRIRYIFELIFSDLLGIKIQITTDPDEFKAFKSAKINYSARKFDFSLDIIPANLLFETGIRQQQISLSEWEGLPVFFRVSPGAGLPFDPFAMAFYLVTRYEEYLPHDQDRHGRFMPENSLAFKEGFLEKPLVDMLALKLKKKINELFSELVFPDIHYCFIPTIDIDLAFAHHGKGLMRGIAGYCKLMACFKFKEILTRTGVLLGLTDDPYDNFDFQRHVFEKYDLIPLYFVLLGDFGKFDRNISHRNKSFRDLLLNLTSYAQIGIHPSYASVADPEILKREILRLENIIRKTVTISRQHFLKLDFPETYNRLACNHIFHDYSMGYASCLGFRAGISRSYMFYDLKNEQELPVRIHPFVFMDTAMRDYMHVKPVDYIKFVYPLIEILKQVNGELIGIWHNYAMSDNADELKAFEEIIKAADNDQVP